MGALYIPAADCAGLLTPLLSYRQNLVKQSQRNVRHIEAPCSTSRCRLVRSALHSICGLSVRSISAKQFAPTGGGFVED